MKLVDQNGDALQPVNDEVFAYGTRAKKSELEESTVKTDAGNYTVTAIKELPCPGSIKENIIHLPVR